MRPSSSPGSDLHVAAALESEGLWGDEPTSAVAPDMQHEQCGRIEDDDVLHPLRKIEAGPELQILRLVPFADDLDDGLRQELDGVVLLIGFATENRDIRALSDPSGN